MSEVVKEVQRRVTDLFARMFDKWGFGYGTGVVYGFLFFSDEPLGLRELTELAGYSKSYIHSCLTKLVKMGLVKRDRVIGSRKEVYYCKRGGESMVIDVFRRILKEDVENVLETCNWGIRKLKEKGEEDSLTAMRLKRLKRFYERVRDLLESLIDAGVLEGGEYEE